MAADEQLTKTEQAVTKATEIVTNKRTRSVIFLALSGVLILGINSMLPVIEGDAHYTAGTVETTYGEFQTSQDSDEHIRLTWASEQSVSLYKAQYIRSHPELTEDEWMLVTVPDTFRVRIYTKFFYEHPFWYISTATSLGSALILFYSMFNYLITVMREKYKKYVDLDNKMTDAVDKFLDPVTFEPWIDNDFNTRRKIQQHKFNVKYKIDKLERKTPYKVKRKLKPYFDELRQFNKIRREDEALITYNPKDILKGLGPLKFREQHYLNKKERLLYLLDDAYIEEYVVSGRVKYFRYVYPMFVYNGENGLGKTIDSYSLIKTDAKRISSDASSKMIISLVVTFLFAVLTTVTVVASVEQQPFWIIINTISKLAPLVIQVPLAINYSNDFMNKQLIGNLISRHSILLLYLAETKGGTAYATPN